MRNENISESLLKVLDSQGYTFQYTVLRRAEELFRDAKSRWRLIGVEVPVSIQEVDTRIDFVLKHIDWDLYLIAECKRANPAISNWCFLKVQTLQNDRFSDIAIIDRLEYRPQHDILSSAVGLRHNDMLYQLGIEVRTQDTGDPRGKGKGAIEDASSQVMKGTNGFIMKYTHDAALRSKDEYKAALFLPAVFTTADLFTSKADIAEAEIKNGTLRSPPPTEEQPWVWLEYHVSPSLKHVVPFDNRKPKELSDLLVHEYWRAIAVINPKGIEAFLRKEWSPQELQ